MRQRTFFAVRVMTGIPLASGTTKGSGERGVNGQQRTGKAAGEVRHRVSGSEELHDPAKKRLLDALFEGAGKRRLPYGGVPTFLDLPFKDDLPNSISR